MEVLESQMAGVVLFLLARLVPYSSGGFAVSYMHTIAFTQEGTAAASN